MSQNLSSFSASKTYSQWAQRKRCAYYYGLYQIPKERSNANEYILSMHRFRWTFRNLRHRRKYRLKRNKSNGNITLRHLRFSHNVNRTSWLQRNQEREVINMTRFEERGIDRQYSARNIGEAKKAFEISCQICASQGKYINCAHCMIASVHNLIAEIFIA